jgi:RimJ/RimL family protein N-acetyltransferase
MNISTARLSLRPLTKATPRQVAWLRDPEVTRFSERRHETPNLSAQLRYINSFGGQSRVWGIFDIGSGEHIGNLTAVHDEPNNVSDIGIMIGETKFWGKGLGKEAWQAATNWLISRDGGCIRKLEAGAMKTNTAMIRIIRSTGFVQEGERLNHFLCAGAPISALLFGRSK